MNNATIQITQENIIYDLIAKNPSEVITALSQRLLKSQCINNLDDFIESVWQRENEIPTNIGKGIAIPHGKSRTVQFSSIAMARLKYPVSWSHEDDEPVQYVFLLAIKEGDEKDEHLRQLAYLSTKLMDDSYVDTLKQAENLDELTLSLNQSQS